MEDEQSKSSWIKSVLSYTGFSSRSIIVRQLQAAAYGLLVNFIITQLLIRFIDEDFRNWSVKRTLVLSSLSLLLAFIFRKLKRVAKSQNWGGGAVSGIDDAAGPGPEISTDYSAFTCFRFPALQLLPAEAEVTSTQASTNRKMERGRAPEPLGSSSLSEKQSQSSQPPPPSYQLQWVTSVSPSSSLHPHRGLLPSAPQSPMEEKERLRNSAGTSRFKHKNLKARSMYSSILHENLLSESASFHPASLPKLASAWPDTHHNRERNHAAPRGSSDPQPGLWAWQFLEEHNFAEFKNDYSRFRNINISSLHHDQALTVKKVDSSNFKPDASDRITEASPESDDQFPNTEAAIQANPVTEPKRWKRNTVDRGERRKGGCLKRVLSSFCIQTLRRKREQQRRPRRNSRRFVQISPVAPFSSPQW